MYLRTSLARAWARLLTSTSWWVPMLVLATVFVTSWVAMWLAEPDAALVEPQTYWWWFLITSSTVGYGDFFPATTAGQVVGAYVVVGGIITLTTLFTTLTTMIAATKGRRMQGQISHDLSDHLVVVGYHPGRTGALVRDMIADGIEHVVVCAFDDQAEQHPLFEQEGVEFVRGDLTDVAVLARAAVVRARAVLVDGRDDNEALTLTVAAEQAAPGVHTVVTLRDMSRTRTIHRVDDTVQCIQWHSVQMIREELQDPGISTVYEELTSPGGASTWSTTVADADGGHTFGQWQARFGERHAAMILGMRVGSATKVSPAWDAIVPAGAQLFYISDTRLDAHDLHQAIAP